MKENVHPLAAMIDGGGHQYAAKHLGQLEKHFTAVIQRVLKEQPDDPLLAASRYLLELHSEETGKPAVVSAAPGPGAIASPAKKRPPFNPEEEETAYSPPMKVDPIKVKEDDAPLPPRPAAIAPPSPTMNVGGLFERGSSASSCSSLGSGLFERGSAPTRSLVNNKPSSPHVPRLNNLTERVEAAKAADRLAATLAAEEAAAEAAAQAETEQAWNELGQAGIELGSGSEDDSSDEGYE